MIFCIKMKLSCGIFHILFLSVFLFFEVNLFKHGKIPKISCYVLKIRKISYISDKQIIIRFLRPLLQTFGFDASQVLVC